MGLIENAAREAGMTIERDVPIVGQRRCKDWSKLIGIARKLESEEERITTAETRKIAQLSVENSQLSDEKAELNRKLYQVGVKLAEYELKERMNEANISDKDQKFLLGASAENSDKATEPVTA